MQLKRCFHALSVQSKLIRPTIILAAITMFFIACESKNKADPLFSKLSAAQTGIDFQSINIDFDTLNILDYLYYYNGAGVAAGDINKDGLPDIFFAGNNGGNKLYLNKGDFNFEDITATSKITGNVAWTTGVTMADVNGDGWLDIYVCTVSDHSPFGSSHVYFQNSSNQLFLNNGNNTFSESAEKYGLNIKGYNTHATFFDYDKDGDLDLFLLQHSVHQTDNYGDTSIRRKYSAVSGGKLLKNNNDHFTDVTLEAGIISSSLGYGLGVAVADLNHDGYDDIYVSNDFHENDYYYVNQKNGTFLEQNKTSFAHQSKFSMGNDVADINNDGWPDIFTLDMLPEDEKVLKSSQGDQTFDIYNAQITYGYNYQYSRNCLQLNVGKGNQFADIALYSGVSATDWSWSPLIADYDLDGKNDIFISNGIKNRLNDLDYIKFLSQDIRPVNPEIAKQHDQEILAHLPPASWHNYIYKGEKDLKFTDKSVEWGFGDSTLSNGAAFADLDKDGDLDIITNDLNAPAGIYRNNARQKYADRKFIAIELKGKTPNTLGIGTKIFLFQKGKLYYQQLQNSRGFMSSVEPILYFGLDTTSIIDSIIICWPHNRMEKLENIKTNQKIIISYDERNTQPVIDHTSMVNTLLKSDTANLFEDITEAEGINFIHKENAEFVDFNHQLFIPHAISTEGPKIAVGDVNGDGFQDFFVCGAKGQAGQLFIQNKDGKFQNLPSPAFEENKNSEEVCALFFDADNNGSLDLYVVNGGNEPSPDQTLLTDRLYLNNGNGKFYISKGLPFFSGNKSVVCAGDMDNDGDLDLFVGGRSDPKCYGIIPESYLLENDGKGNFSIVTDNISPDLKKIGLVTAASWVDVDKDEQEDLIIAGEWMQPILFKNYGGKLKQQNLTVHDENLKGWYSSLKIMDINKDGYQDIFLGNLGLNSKLTGSPKYPLKMFVKDLDGNKITDQIVAIEKKGKYYPWLGKVELERQLPYLKKTYLSYSKMAGKTIEEIFGDKLNDATIFEINNLSSLILINNKKGNYSIQNLPPPFQWTPIYSLAEIKFNTNQTALLAGGGFYGVQPFEGKYDALPLSMYKNVDKGNLEVCFPVEEALQKIKGEVRDIKMIKLAGNKSGYLIARNNKPLILLQLKNKN